MGHVFLENHIQRLQSNFIIPKTLTGFVKLFLFLHLREKYPTQCTTGGTLVFSKLTAHRSGQRDQQSYCAP